MVCEDKSILKDRIIVAAQQIASVYGASVIFDEENKVNKSRQTALKSALYNLQESLKIINEEEI